MQIAQQRSEHGLTTNFVKSMQQTTSLLSAVSGRLLVKYIFISTC